MVVAGGAGSVAGESGGEAGLELGGEEGVRRTGDLGSAWSGAAGWPRAWECTGVAVPPGKVSNGGTEFWKTTALGKLLEVAASRHVGVNS